MGQRIGGGRRKKLTADAELRQIVALSVRFGIPPSELMQWTVTDFSLVLALLKLEHDGRQ